MCDIRASLGFSFVCFKPQFLREHDVALRELASWEHAPVLDGISFHIQLVDIVHSTFTNLEYIS